MNSSTPDDDPLHGLNPAALLSLAALPTEDGANTLPLNPDDLPALDEISVAFPDLEILDLIGYGGMSAVFRARQTKLDRLVALKVLPKSLAATPGFTERFTREGRVLARLSHPHIVAVHDFGENCGFCYLILEYVDGVNLREAMRAGRFTPEQALTIVPVLCDALHFAHSHGVLHRDIKPENILLDSRGRVKIADFGIAKIIGEEGGDAMLLTQSGARLGTAPYMAPEQIEAPASVDHRADIYSLGVVFYEMLTGELPLGRFAPPSEKAEVSGGMDAVVFRALDKERSRRQQSAEEFKTEIAGVGAATGVARTLAVPKSGENAGLPRMISMRVFTLILASMFLVTVIWWLMTRWAPIAADQARLLWPTLITCVGLLFGAVGLPLWLRLVPMNSILGIRLPSTFTSHQRWYDVNAFAGRHLCGWAQVIITAGIAGFYQLPRHLSAYPWATTVLLLFSVVATVVSTMLWNGRFPAKPDRWLRAIGQFVIALVIAMFIKTFIAGLYRIPIGSEPGVAKGSHWFASHLDTGFRPDDLVIFQHETGQFWIARVVVREEKGLRLKRGAKPEEFFMPWDKIVGKMLFSHFSPGPPFNSIESPFNSIESPFNSIESPIRDTDFQKSTSGATPLEPVCEGTAKALDKEPALRFVRLKQNQKEWTWPMYSPDGAPVPDAVSSQLIEASAGGDVETQNPDDCWLQLWFEHPDFDQHSHMMTEISGGDGQTLEDRDGSICANMGQPNPALFSYVCSPGRAGNLPKQIQVKLHYGIGPWRSRQSVKADFNGTMALGGDCLLAGFGEGADGKAFLKWSKGTGSSDLQFDAMAILKDGRRVGSSDRSLSSVAGNYVEGVKFSVPFREVASFGIRTRELKTITFEKVVVPPLL